MPNYVDARNVYTESLMDGCEANLTNDNEAMVLDELAQLLVDMMDHCEQTLLAEPAICAAHTALLATRQRIASPFAEPTTGAEIIDYCGADAAKWAREFCKMAAKLRVVQIEEGPASSAMAHPIDEGWMLGWFANAIETAIAYRARHRQQLQGAEIVYAVFGWLTSRREPVTFSAAHGAAIGAELAGEFIKRNDLDDVRPEWSKYIKHPEK